MKKFRLYYEEYNRGPFQLLWGHFGRQHTALFGLAGIGILLAMALITLVLIPHDPYFQDPEFLRYCRHHGKRMAWLSTR
ncbi:MAG: hypothetical protein U5L01_04545 [Rheinheimera sp.]|nr:hypothetical protein [Rheinheimera sp.]